MKVFLQNQSQYCDRSDGADDYVNVPRLKRARKRCRRIGKSAKRMIIEMHQMTVAVAAETL